MPLLAVLRVLRRMDPQMSCAWIGTPTGPEGPFVRSEQVKFYALPVAKLDRFFSWRWLTFPFDWARARHEATRMIKEIRPDIVVAAGGYTAIPVVLAAVKRGIPCATHQLDVEPVRTNRWIARYCGSVTTSFAYADAPFGDQVHDVQIATPVAIAEKALPSREKALHHFGLDTKRVTVFLFGGGTGALALNEMVARTKDRWLSFTQFLHGTGIGKGRAAQDHASGYVSKPIFDKDMRDAFAAADLVICRAGMATLSEIAWSQKAAILIPLPTSPQEANAKAFEERGAAVIIDQRRVDFDDALMKTARRLLRDTETRQAMGARAHAFLPTDDGTALAQRLMNLLKKER